MHVRRGHLNGNNNGTNTNDGRELLTNAINLNASATTAMNSSMLSNMAATVTAITGSSNNSNNNNLSVVNNNNINQGMGAGPDRTQENAGMVIDLDPLTEMRSANGMDMSQRILEAALMRGSLALTTPNHFGTLMNLPEQLFATETTAGGQESAEDLMMSGALPLPPLPPAIEHMLVLPTQQMAPLAQTNTTAGTSSMGGGFSGSSRGNNGQRDSLRPFVCPICGKGFPRKGELERHESVHTGARPYVCTVCEKRFSRKDKLVRHKRTHLVHGNGGFGGQQQQQQQGPQMQHHQEQQQRVEGPRLPQISFTAALENFRRTEMMNSSRPPPNVPQQQMLVMGGEGRMREDPLPGMSSMVMEPKDFSFKPNFYSQINIGEEAEEGTRRGGGEETVARIKEEF